MFYRLRRGCTWKLFVIIVISMLYCLHVFNRRDIIKSKERRLITSEVKYPKYLQLQAEQVKFTNINIGKSSSVDQNQCKIPLMPVWPDYVRKWNPAEFVHDCSYEKKLMSVQGNKMMLNVEVNSSACCIHGIIRGWKDSVFNFTECKPVRKKSIRIPNKEVFLLRCGNYTNVDANVLTKKVAQKKVLYWKKINKTQRPFSVFILGIDSTSRSHVYRSIPETLQIMKRLDFTDFRAYHSLAASTLTNFMGMFMGLTRDQVRQTCAPSWGKPFDNCPFIWKDFNESQYITGFIEDNEQSFNWRGQSGFIRPPTDYYIHHLFLALAKIRKHANVTKLNKDCTSTETVPQFVLRYTKQWLKKFVHFPFFFITWLTYPFHENQYSLPNLDKDLANFLVSLNQSGLMERSLIIFVSDHGDKKRFFKGMSTENFFERLLPPLFIHLPNQFKELYPEYSENFKLNSQRLVTPFDIHHTLLHVLALHSNRSDPTFQNFRPTTGNRSSIFERLSSGRNCQTTNIRPENCLCNKNMGSTEISKNLNEKLIALSLQQLNDKVERSNYQNMCYRWNATAKDVIYTSVISNDSINMEILIAFTANPGGAKFEARINCRLPSKDSNHTILAFSGISRINRYKDQSWCVPTSTDQDKELKEFCICKMRRQQHHKRKKEAVVP